MEPGFVRVASSHEVGGPPFRAVEVDGRPILLARLADGSLRAFSGVCPHLGSPLRSAILDGATVECPFHFYAYDLDTGCNVAPGDGADRALQVFDVIEVDGAVHVRVPPDLPPQPTGIDPP